MQRRRQIIPGHQVVVMLSAAPLQIYRSELASACPGSEERTPGAGIAGMVARTSAIHQPSLAIQWMVAMRNMPPPGTISSFPYRKLWTICMPRHYCVPALSVFAVCGWRGWSKESAWACLVSAHPRTWQLPSCEHGYVKCTFQPEEPRIANWPSRSVLLGRGCYCEAACRTRPRRDLRSKW